MLQQCWPDTLARVLCDFFGWWLLFSVVFVPSTVVTTMTGLLSWLWRACPLPRVISFLAKSVLQLLAEGLLLGCWYACLALVTWCVSGILIFQLIVAASALPWLTAMVLLMIAVQLMKDLLSK
jgi:hypothetical protein